MNHSISKDDREFLSQVESCQLPVEAFGHRAHLRLAYIYLVDHDVDTAYELTRDAILRILNHNQVDPTKFNVTMTRAWILAVRHFMESAPEADSADVFIDSKPVMLDSKIMMSHYSEEQFFSERARKEFLQPDISPIPLYEEPK